MQTFWKNGYSATSIDALVRSTKIARSGLYGVFGSKWKLFLATVDHYQASVVDAVTAPLHEPQAGLDALIEFLSKFQDAPRPKSRRLGCLIANSIAELANRGRGHQRRSERYFDRIHGGVENALRGAQSRGEIAEAIDVQTKAAELTVLVMGAFLLRRGLVRSDLLQDAIDGAIEGLR